MESDGARVYSLPQISRRQVLRAGVRIIAEQFAPYSDEPDEIPVIEGLRIAFTQMGRAIGKAAQQQVTVYSEALRDWSINLDFVDETGKPLDVPQVREFRNDGRPKKTRQEEPFYVKQDKKKRR